MARPIHRRPWWIYHPGLPIGSIKKKRKPIFSRWNHRKFTPKPNCWMSFSIYQQKYGLAGCSKGWRQMSKKQWSFSFQHDMLREVFFWQSTPDFRPRDDPPFDMRIIHEHPCFETCARRTWYVNFKGNFYVYLRNPPKNARKWRALGEDWWALGLKLLSNPKWSTNPCLATFRSAGKSNISHWPNHKPTILPGVFPSLQESLKLWKTEILSN